MLNMLKVLVRLGSKDLESKMGRARFGIWLFHNGGPHQGITVLMRRLRSVPTWIVREIGTPDLSTEGGLGNKYDAGGCTVVEKVRTGSPK